MPNPYYFRTVVNRLWRIANGTHPGDVPVRTVNALIKAFPPDAPRHVVVQQMLNAVDAYEYARHLLRDPYDQISPAGGSLCPPLPLGEGWGEGSLVLAGEEPPDEDDDPL